MFNLKTTAAIAGLVLTAAVYMPVAIHAATAAFNEPTPSPLPNLLFIGLPENRAGKIDMKNGSCYLHDGFIRDKSDLAKIFVSKNADGVTLCFLDAEDE